MRSLVKDFGLKRALDEVSLDVPRGRIHALAGPNGAGKTTLLRILLGLVRPTGGSARLLGLDPYVDGVALRRRTAYLPAEVHLPPRWTGREIVRYSLSFHRDADPKRAEELSELFVLPLRARVRTYSTGMRQRLGLVLALARSAEALLLDEPTQNLDPVARAVVLGRIRERSRAGALCLLSTHRLEEAESLCEGATFLDRGRVVAPERVRATRDALPSVVRASFAHRVSRDALELPEHARAEGDGLEWVISLRGDPKPLVERVLAHRPARLELRDPGLEEIYAALYAPAAAEGSRT